MRDKLVIALAAVATLMPLQAGAQTRPTPTPAPAPSSTAPTTPVILTAPTRSPAFSRAPFQPVTDPRFANSRYYVAQYQQVQDFGRCAAHIANQRSRALLDSAPNSPTEREQVRRVATLSRACQSYGFAPPVVFLRAGLAEALYKDRPEAEAIHASGTTSTDVSAFGTAEALRSRARLIDDRTFTQIANCYAITSPRQVRTLIYTTHGTPVERDALNKVIESAPSCAEGKSLTAMGGTSFLRAYIAESAYRWATIDGTSSD